MAGTDGFRGVANTTPPSFALDLGRAAARVLGRRVPSSWRHHGSTTMLEASPVAAGFGRWRSIASALRRTAIAYHGAPRRIGRGVGLAQPVRGQRIKLFSPSGPAPDEVEADRSRAVEFGSSHRDRLIVDSGRSPTARLLPSRVSSIDAARSGMNIGVSCQRSAFESPAGPHRAAPVLLITRPDGPTSPRWGATEPAGLAQGSVDNGAFAGLPSTATETV